MGVVVFEHFDELLNGDFKRPDKPLLSPRTRVKKDNVVNPSPEKTKAKPDNMIVGSKVTASATIIAICCVWTNVEIINPNERAVMINKIDKSINKK